MQGRIVTLCLSQIYVCHEYENEKRLPSNLRRLYFYDAQPHRCGGDVEPDDQPYSGTNTQPDDTTGNFSLAPRFCYFCTAPSRKRHMFVCF